MGGSTLQPVRIDVQRTDLAATRSVTTSVPEAQQGEAVLEVVRFGLSANNVTYAAMGDAMAYWQFFPTGEPDWGCVPVWGFATVAESETPVVSVGDVIYGYLPMATHLTVQPGAVTNGVFTDNTAHRAPMAAAYNRYHLVGDPAPTQRLADLRMLFEPLYVTAFLIADAIGSGPGAGATQVVISSASSKTAVAVAHAVGSTPRSDGGFCPKVVGLTSPANTGFVTDLGVYDTVVAYSDTTGLDAVPTVYVDIAGDAAVTATVHRHLADHLVVSMVVGMTHWDAPGPDAAPLGGPQREFFFAPDHLARRSTELGDAALTAAMGAAWHSFARWADTWVTLGSVSGPDSISAVWKGLLGGGNPKVGHVCTWT